ncbi:DUF3817 domain-containing protein [Nocardia sp. NPDC127526]|uniref:DUF3817 domain-containing protein n=1 Tax=Nocardia sp. NPDC127526 TaxID=3345393 RepID=UPI00363F4EC3
MEIFDLSTVAKRVRFFGILEAITWVFLLTGSVLKRLPEPITWPVMVFGMAHGIVFIIFAISCLLASREFEWPAKTTLLALASTIIPFASYFFERWAINTGQLGELSRTPGASAARS